MKISPETLAWTNGSPPVSSLPTNAEAAVAQISPAAPHPPNLRTHPIAPKQLDIEALKLHPSGNTEGTTQDVVEVDVSLGMTKRPRARTDHTQYWWIFIEQILHDEGNTSVLPDLET